MTFFKNDRQHSTNPTRCWVFVDGSERRVLSPYSLFASLDGKVVKTLLGFPVSLLISLSRSTISQRIFVSASTHGERGGGPGEVTECVSLSPAWSLTTRMGSSSEMDWGERHRT